MSTEPSLIGIILLVVVSCLVFIEGYRQLSRRPKFYTQTVRYIVYRPVDEDGVMYDQLTMTVKDFMKMDKSPRMLSVTKNGAYYAVRIVDYAVVRYYNELP